MEERVSGMTQAVAGEDPGGDRAGEIELAVRIEPFPLGEAECRNHPLLPRRLLSQRGRSEPPGDGDRLRQAAAARHADCHREHE